MELKKFIDYGNDEPLTFKMFSGISNDAYINIWKDKNLKDRLTNVTSDFNFALDYSYNFETGEYDDVVIEISNIPLDAFVAYRRNNYKDDDDFKSMNKMKSDKKIETINKYQLFLVDLFPYINQINIKKCEN